MRFCGLMLFTGMLVASPLAAQPGSFSPEERAQGEASIQAAAAFFATTMRDPASATFRDVFIGKRPPPTETLRIIVCGEVNGRNGYGGFTGFQHFIVSGGSVYVGSVGGGSVRDACFTERVFDTRDYSDELTTAFRAAQ